MCIGDKLFMRIFLGVTNVCNILSYLEDGFNELGIECTTLYVNEHIFKYESEKRKFVKVLQYITKKANSCKNSLSIFYIILKDIYMFFLLLYFLFKYDVFIFTYGTTFIRRKLDLPLLKFFRKKVIMLYLGSDCRPPYLAGNRRDLSVDDIRVLTKKMSDAMKVSEKYADYIINYPPQALFQKKKFILGLAVSLPMATNQINKKKNNSICLNRENIIILHSPSSPLDKGTNIVRRIIKSLQKKKYKIKYIEIINKTHAEVLENIQNCDFVIDQVYSDTPMAVFATEAASYGKPAVVGGYYSEYIYSEINKKFIPPSEYVLPECMEAAVVKLIENKKYRLKLGKQAQDYVRLYCNPKKVAERYIDIINNDIPEDWWFNPDNIEYFYGYGYNKDDVRKRIIDLIHDNKFDDLCLSNHLQRKLLSTLNK